MNIPKRLLSALFSVSALFLLLDASAWAQGGGGGGMGGGREGRRRASWEEDFGRGLDKAGKEERFLLLYLHDPEEEDPPTVFNTEEFRRASQDDWVFVREPLEMDNPLRDEYHVQRAPTLIGMDEYGNEFDRAMRVNSTEIRNLMKTVKNQVTLFKKKLAMEYSKGRVALRQKKESKVLDSFSKIVRMRKPGYPEVEKADSWIAGYVGKELDRIRTLPDLSDQLKAGKYLAGKCEGSSVEGRVQIGLALMEHDGGKIREALRRLEEARKKLPRKQADEVRNEREALIAYGLKKIDALVALCDVGEKEAAKDGLKMVRDDYKGTEVSTLAAEELKAIR